jgi:transcriptional regulator GlxA family with amidase domain
MVSPRTLQRRLHEAGTATRLLTRTVRLVRAGDSLVSGPDRASLTTVAQACGFADSAHFSREFRALIGVQPGQFARALTHR